MRNLRPYGIGSPGVSLPSTTRITEASRVSLGDALESPAGCRVRLFVPGLGFQPCDLLGGHAGRCRIVMWVDAPDG
jgi:hypothetical protein